MQLGLFFCSYITIKHHFRSNVSTDSTDSLSPGAGELQLLETHSNSNVTSSTVDNFFQIDRRVLLPERGRAFTCPVPLRARTISERAEEKDQVFTKVPRPCLAPQYFEYCGFFKSPRPISSIYIMCCLFVEGDALALNSTTWVEFLSCHFLQCKSKRSPSL